MGENRYDTAVTELHNVASDLAQMESQVAICQRTIDAAEHLLKFDISLIGLEEDGYLHPKAVSSGLSPDEFEAMSIQKGIAGKTYRTGKSYLIDDITTLDDANPQGEWRSSISLPVGEHGNFQAVDNERGVFDEQDLRLAELLTTHASNHLNRLTKKQELERQNDRLEEFASIVSHDLRNPLNVADLQLDLARKEGDNEHLAAVATAHERMERLIDDLLALAREGRKVADKEPVALDEVVKRCWQNVDTAEATLVADTDCTIRADRSRLTQLLENLIRNAVEHGGENVTITVGDLNDGFYVADDGPGIPVDEREHIFDSGYSTSDDGTGFGLAIVQEIVEAHDWTIAVTESVASGARFEISDITIPATD